MSDKQWLTTEETHALREQGAPLCYIKALGELNYRPEMAKHHQYSPRYGVFQYCSARRSLGGAQRTLIEIREALAPHLGPSRSIKDPTGSNAFWIAWRTVPGWTMSVSADQYPYDPEWFTTALLIHRRFSDRASQAQMDREVKIALWGPYEEEWPGRPYTGPLLEPFIDKPRRHPRAAMFDEFNCEGAASAVTAQATLTAAQPTLTGSGKSLNIPSLEGLFINE